MKKYKFSILYNFGTKYCRDEIKANLKSLYLSFLKCLFVNSFVNFFLPRYLIFRGIREIISGFDLINGRVYKIYFTYKWKFRNNGVNIKNKILRDLF